MLTRHMKEAHGVGEGQGKDERLTVQRQYKDSAYRRQLRDDNEPSLVVYIVCAGQRETRKGMFSKTRAGLIDHGFAPQRIHRLHGFDPRKPPRGFDSTDTRKSNFLTQYFLQHFAPIAAAKLNEPGIEYVCWAEDDCRVKPDVSAKEVANEIRDAAPAASWLGYMNVDGVPRYGAHLIGFNKVSLSRAVQAAQELYDQKPRALDTVLFYLHAAGIIHTPDESMASQRLHELAGRRLPDD